MSRRSQMLFAAILACGSISVVTTTQSAPKSLTVENFVHMSFHGSVEQVGEFYANLRREFETQKIKGVSANDRPYLVIHGNPDKTKNLNMDLGFAVQGGTPAVKAPLKHSRLNFPRGESVDHNGPFTGLSQAHQEILKNTKGQEQDMVILHLLSQSGNQGNVELIQPLK